VKKSRKNIWTTMELNLRPPEYEAIALLTELESHAEKREKN
jgi:hypothetical protein